MKDCNITTFLLFNCAPFRPNLSKIGGVLDEMQKSGPTKYLQHQQSWPMGWQGCKYHNFINLMNLFFPGTPDHDGHYLRELVKQVISLALLFRLGVSTDTDQFANNSILSNQYFEI